MKRISLFVLCLIMVVTSVVSCGSKEKEGKKVKSIKEVVGEESHIPDDLAFEGEVFKILCREDKDYGDYVYEIVADEGDTNNVNQAVYERNRTVMDTFGLADIQAVPIAGDYASKDIFINKMRNSIDAGLGEYDLIMSQQGYMNEGELVQYFYNYYDVPYISDTLKCTKHDHSYYYDDVKSEITINGKLKYMVGDFSLTYWEHVYALYFNKQIAEEYNLEDIYELVRNGEWTFDKMIEMTTGKWKDLNADDWSGSEDSFGYLSELLNPVNSMDVHFGVDPTHKDENGNIVIEYDVGKMTNILTKVLEFRDSNDTYFADVSSNVTIADNPCDKIFSEGRALFYHAILGKADSFRSMDTDFGIVPYPKWDGNQDRYLTRSMDGYSVACVPVDASNLELTGAVFDTLSAVSQTTVIPAYYDMALSYKYTRDDESAEMLDIIRDGFRVNFGKFYSIDCGKALRDTVYYKNPSFSSFYQSNLPGYQIKLDELLKYYED